MGHAHEHTDSGDTEFYTPPVVIEAARTVLMQGDCMQLLQEIPSGQVDMLLTDPPYELSKSKGGGMMGCGGRKYAGELRDAGMVSGIDTAGFLSLCLNLFANKQNFCGVFFCSTKQLVEYLRWAEANSLQYGVGVWHKSNPPPLCNYKYLNDVEYWVYIKGNKSKILGSYQSKSMVYKSQVNKADKVKYGHPTIKPLDLTEKIIINHTTEGAHILDPFMGSGTTGVAARDLGRRFTGVELDADYFNVARARIFPHGEDLV